MKLKGWLFCLSLLFAFATGNAQEVMREFKTGDQFPDFKYLDINGKEVTLENLKGKYVYVDIWTTWCGPCKAELPYLKKLEKKFKRKNIVFLSISGDQNKTAWEKMVKEKKLKGIQLHHGKDVYFITKFGVMGFPRFYLLDKEGKLVNPVMTRPSDPETIKTLKALEGI